MRLATSRYKLLQFVWNCFMAVSLTLYGVDAEVQLLAAPKDTTVDVGRTMNLTCIIAETYDERISHELQWIISWDATASVQQIPVNLSQDITGFHYGRPAERGDYSIEYERKQLSTPGTDCTHVVHISALHIRNATLRDAGTFACINEWHAKATVAVVENSSSDLADCDLIVVILGLACVVGWCLTVVQFGILICMCVKKPKHAARRRRIRRHVSFILPQSRRAAYDIRTANQLEQDNHGYSDDDESMVQQVQRRVEYEPEEKEKLETPEMYINLKEGQVSTRQDNQRFPLVTFRPGTPESSSTPSRYKKKDKKKHKNNGAIKKTKNTDSSLAIVKPFEVQNMQTQDHGQNHAVFNQVHRQNPVFNYNFNHDESYEHLPDDLPDGQVGELPHKLPLYNNMFTLSQPADDSDPDEMVSTPL